MQGVSCFERQPHGDVAGAGGVRMGDLEKCGGVRPPTDRGTRRSDPGTLHAGTTMPPASTKPADRILFIGNSFTARNDVPGMVAAMGAAGGRPMACRLISRGVAYLRMHWNKGEAGAAIRNGKFSSVVLQEQSTLPVKNAAKMHESVRLFDAAIRGAGARTVLYMTWARRHAPDSQRAITEAYESIGRELGAAVAPAGVAWERVLGAGGGPVLHDEDGSHPTLAGSYLAACVLFRTLAGLPAPERGADPEGLSAAEARLLRGAARAVVA